MNRSQAPLNDTEPRAADSSAERWEQWCQTYDSRFEESQQLQNEQEDRELAARSRSLTAWLWLVMGITFVEICQARSDAPYLRYVLGMLAVCLTGVWLTLGRSNLLVRALVGLAFVFSLAAAQPHTASVLFACVMLSTTLCYLLLAIVTYFTRLRSRRLMFSILDIGGYMLLIGCGIGIMQSGGTDKLVNFFSSANLSNLLLTLFFSGNTVLASLPILVPERYRRDDKRLRKLSAGLVLGITPPIECLIFALLGFQVNVTFFGGLWLTHAVGLVVVWAFVFRLETAETLRDDEVDSSGTTEAAAECWEEIV